MILQEFPVTQNAYSVFDYGLAAMVLMVLGVTLFFVFRTLRTVLGDNARTMGQMTDLLRVMNEQLITLLIHIRSLQESLFDHDDRHRKDPR